MSEQGTERVMKLPLVAADAPDIEALVALIRRLTVVQSIDEIMEIVTHAARALLGADGITFVLREGELCYYAEEDAIAPLWKGKRFPMKACISGWCMTECRAAAIPDIAQDPRIPQDAYRPTFVRSLAMVPVRQDDPVAAMGAYWSCVRDIDHAEVELLQTVANAAALALTRIELERERDKVRTAQRELSHRLRNMLTVVQSIAHQSFRSAERLEDAQQIFSRRLQALANSQMLLFEAGEAGADLHALIREQLMMDCNERQLDCTGPEVFLGADEAFDLGLVLHELGTNARKYGALSRGKGRVTIEWEIARAEDRRVVELVWSEAGGPAVCPPARTGFGSALIRSAFRQNGGNAELRYEPSGLICAVRIPLP